MFLSEGVELAKAHQAEMLRKAENLRLLKEARANRPSPQERFLLHLGDLLVSIGLRLKERYSLSDASSTGNASHSLVVHCLLHSSSGNTKNL